MIRTIEIRGIGPHTSSTIDIPDPMGHTEISGPSQAGKSLLVDAVTFALFGLDQTGRAIAVEQITDGADEAASAVTLASGTRVSRRLRRKGRRITRGISGVANKTEQAHREALGPLGDLGPWSLPLRIMAPMGWLELAQSAGGGRDLRDALASLGEEVDIREVVADMMQAEGLDYGPADAANESGARAQRKRAREAHQRAVGALEETERLVMAGDALQPVPDEPVDALAVVGLGAEWASYRYSSEGAAEHARAVQAAAAWDQRLAAIGPQPEDAGSALVSLRADMRAAKGRRRRRETAADDAAAELARLERVAAEAERPADLPHELANEAPLLTERLRVAQRHLDDLRSADGTCPTCSQPWDRSEAIAAAELAVSGCSGEVATAELRATEWLDAEEERRAIRCDGMAGEVEAARAVVETARRARDEAAAEVAAIDQRIASAGAPGREWSAAHKALGRRPRIPPAPQGDEPPTEHEPTDEELQTARDAIADAERQRGAAEHHQHTVTQARARVEQLRDEVTTAAAELARCEALLRCCRIAPTEAARRSLEALGDISPVSMRWTESGGVDVLVDGRPWRYASQGRQIVADAALRAGMRRALGMPWLLLVIDQVQSVAGMELPDIEGPVWRLRTTDGDGLSVVAL